MCKKYIIPTAICLLSFVLASTFFAEAAELTGKWEASILGHRVKAEALQQGENLSGVAYLYDLFGNRSTWHFKGLVKGNKVVASHHTGHVFNGDVTPDGRLVGVLSTNNGHKIPIDVKGSGR